MPDKKKDVMKKKTTVKKAEPKKPAGKVRKPRTK
ncbi:MAG: hypothetical protein ACI9EW_003019 [Cellvibrionaceae bacterium]|jgi:hypothetical protein